MEEKKRTNQKTRQVGNRRTVLYTKVKYQTAGNFNITIATVKEKQYNKRKKKV